MQLTELTLGPTVAGGDTLAREPEGRVVFVRGGLPGETVRVRYREQKKDFARADVIEVVQSSDHRQPMPCPHARAGCGGCGWMHIDLAGQRDMKRAIVLDALRRTAGLSDPTVIDGPTLPSTGFRTALRMVVVGDRLGLRKYKTHDMIALDDCMVAHPLLDEIIADGRFPGVEEVSLRVGLATGERSALMHPGGQAQKVTVPDGVRVGPRSTVHETVAGRSFRITATSFFQSRTDGAEALVAAVGEAAGPLAGRRFIDAYGGVGLFASTLGEDAEVVVVEDNPSSCRDATVNLYQRAFTVTQSSVERWTPESADVVIADPARAGLGKEAVPVLAKVGAERFVLVSCDPVAMARDAKLLAGHGYELATSTLIDLFPHTPHIEIVSTFNLR